MEKEGVDRSLKHRTVYWTCHRHHNTSVSDYKNNNTCTRGHSQGGTEGGGTPINEPFSIKLFFKPLVDTVITKSTYIFFIFFLNQDN